MSNCDCKKKVDFVKKITYEKREKRGRPLNFRQNIIKRTLRNFTCCCMKKQEEIEPQPQPIVAPGIKKALLVGINYIGTNGELGGCINDVNNIQNMLINKYKYENANILKLTDHTSIKPTYNNIINELKKLILSGATKMYFHYSGHGSYMTDNNGDEKKDGRDECLVPIDYNRYGFIRDDKLKDIIKLLKPNQELICVVDACHSASMFDLKHEVDCTSVKVSNTPDTNDYLYPNWTYDFHVSENPNYNEQVNVFTISGCRDKEVSADSYINGKYQGALTHHFMKALELNNYNIKIKYLLKDIHCMLEIGGYDQNPVITSSNKVNLDDKFSL